MLRFAANLSFLYGEYAFPDRFAAAARDGFTAVEYLFPYEIRRNNWLRGCNRMGWFRPCSMPRRETGRRGSEGWPACRAGRRSFRGYTHCP